MGTFKLHWVQTLDVLHFPYDVCGGKCPFLEQELSLVRPDRGGLHYLEVLGEKVRGQYVARERRSVASCLDKLPVDQEGYGSSIGIGKVKKTAIAPVWFSL